MFRILEILLEGLVLYLLYRFVVFFVIPIIHTIRKAKRQMRDMNARVNEEMNNRKRRYNENRQRQQAGHNNIHTSAQQSESEDEGEYIDYEEVS